MNWLNCCELKVSIQSVNIIDGNKIVLKYHKFFCFQIRLNLDDIKLVVAIQKQDFESKSTAKTTVEIV